MNKIHGFKKIESQYITEVGAEVAIYEHERLGAKLLHIPNDDDNKVFNIQFNTIPEDDTGIAHILEHSVLAGSEKYPLKEPFVNLLKGSLNTFLNAMTSSDKTFYPFASQNEQDFLNILDVYLDAVFAPRITSDPLTLRQEGWRIEQFSDQDKPYFNGIVFNEMKGAMSAPDSRLDQITRKAIFDNTYQYNSGGQPAAILDLTDQDFLDFYKNNYHPSNSIIFLYGDMPAEPIFEILNERFEKYEKLDRVPKVEHTTPLDQPQYRTGVYPAQENDLRYAQIQLVLPRIAKDDFMLTANAMQVTALALFSMESSTLRQDIIASGLAQEIYAQADFNKYDPNLSIMLVGIPDLSPEEIENAIWEKIDQTQKNYEKDVFAAVLNSYSFNMRESDNQSTPQGLVLGLRSGMVWSYGISPFEALSFEPRLEALEEKIDTDYFSKLIEENIIKNKHRVTAVLRPSPTEAEQSAQVEAEKLNQKYEALSPSEKKSLIQMNKDLEAKQNSPDSPEALATLPKLKRSDLRQDHNYQMIDRSSLKLNAEEKLPLLTYFGNSKGIVYLGLQFDLDRISADELFELSLLTEIWGNLDTENYSYQDLTNYSLTHTGGISINLSYSENRRYLEIRIKMLEQQIDKGLHILEEILLRTKFDDQARIQTLISSLFSGLQLNLVDDGINLARKRLRSYLDHSGKFSDLTSGITFYQKLGRLLENWDQEVAALSEKFLSLIKRLVIRDQTTIYFAGEEQAFTNIKEQLVTSFLKYPDWTRSGLTESEAPHQEWNFELEIANEAFIVPSDVQFVLAGNNLKTIQTDWKFNGNLHILRQIINTDYLWNQIRVKGGAYGSNMSIDRQGNLLLSSYRDPECAGTYNIYAKLGQYLSDLDLSKDELTSYMIGAFSSLDQPLSFPLAGRRAKNLYDHGITADQLQIERDQALATEPEELKAYAELISQAISENIRCTVGGSEKLKEDRNLFNSLEILN